MSPRLRVSPGWHPCNKLGPLGPVAIELESTWRFQKSNGLKLNAISGSTAPRRHSRGSGMKSGIPTNSVGMTSLCLKNVHRGTVAVRCGPSWPLLGSVMSLNATVGRFRGNVPTNDGSTVTGLMKRHDLAKRSPRSRGTRTGRSLANRPNTSFQRALTRGGFGPLSSDR